MVVVEACGPFLFRHHGMIELGGRQRAEDVSG